jgi:hypothetical protein
VYEVGSGELGPPPKVQNFYRLFATPYEKVHDDTIVTVLHNRSAKHNMSKGLYQSKKIIAILNMNYEKIDVCEKIACYSRRSTRTTLNACIMVCPNT